MIDTEIVKQMIMKQALQYLKNMPESDKRQIVLAVIQICKMDREACVNLLKLANAVKLACEKVLNGEIK